MLEERRKVLNEELAGLGERVGVLIKDELVAALLSEKVVT